MNQKVKNTLEGLSGAVITVAGMALVGAGIIGGEILIFYGPSGLTKALFDLGLKNSSIHVQKQYYKINYRGKKGNLVFKKSYNKMQGETTYLLLGNTSLGHLDDMNGVCLEDGGCNGSVNRIQDSYNNLSRYDVGTTNDPQKRALLEERFAKADKIFASFTSKGKLADLIKKAEAEWKEKYDIPKEGDVLDHYLN